MSDVLVGGLLAIAGGLVGGLGGVLVQGKLSRDAEQRAEARARTDRLRGHRLELLRASLRMYVAMAEQLRATAAGESAEQQARLRQQVESSANLGAGPGVFGPEGVPVITGLAAASQKLIDRPPGSGVTKSEVEEFGRWESQLQALYVAAAERILSD